MYGLSRSPSLQSARLETPDLTFAIVVGLYVAALFTPAVVGLVDQLITLDPAGLYIALLSVATVLGVIGGVLSRQIRGLPERLGASPFSWLFALLAIPVGGGYALALFSDQYLLSALAFLGFLSSTVGVLLGVLVRVMSLNRYTKAVLRDVPTTCEWTAGWPTRQRTLLGGAALLAMLFGFVAGFLDLLPGGSAVESLGWLAYIFGAAFLSAGQPRTYRVSSKGLERKLPVLRKLHPWDALEAIEVREDVLLVHRRGWWRPAFRCTWAEIDDRGAVVSALDEHLETR